MRASHLIIAWVAFQSMAPAWAGENNPNVQTGYNDGFYIKTDDDRFRLKVGSRIAFSFTEGFVSPAEDFGTFDFLYAKFFAGGNAFGPDVQYYIQASAADNLRPLGPSPNFASDTGTFTLEDYFVRVNRSEFSFKLGRFKVPFGREWMVFTGNSEFVDRSAATQAFTFGRDLGITFSSERPKFSLTAGLFNGGSDAALGVGYNPSTASASSPGSPLAASTGGHGLLYLARIVAMPLGAAGYSEGDVENSEGGRLDLGAGIAFDHHRDADFNWDQILDDNRVSVLSVGSDWTWKRSGKSFQGEFFYRKIYGSLTADTRGIGFYAQPGFFFIPGKLELAGRFGWLDPNLDQSDDEIFEAAAATNVYISSDHRYKAQLQYTWRRQKQLGVAVNDDSFIDLMFQLTI